MDDFAVFADDFLDGMVTDVDTASRLFVIEAHRRNRRATPRDTGLTFRAHQLDIPKKTTWLPVAWAAALDLGLYTNPGLPRWHRSRAGVVVDQGIRHHRDGSNSKKWKVIRTEKTGFSNRAKNGIVASYFDKFLEIFDRELRRASR